MTCENEEALERGKELMEIDIADASNGCMTEIKEIDISDASDGCMTQKKENGLLCWPVLPKKGGEGFPFAPSNFPNPGDNWVWRVGNRVTNKGYYTDRYLYLPMRLQKPGMKTYFFKSRISAENYIRANFPSADVKALFSSFIWKIPSKEAYILKGEDGSLRISFGEMADQSPFNPTPGVAVCKAGNRFCSSLGKGESSPLSATQSCNICCSEPNFCRECCCILCCSTIDLAFGGYSFIRCGSLVSDGLICGHAAHVNCALRSYMAGFVGGSVGLDTEYYCRRCDSRTDLTEHVSGLLKTCESIGSQDDIEKILSIGACILRGSKKKGSQKLLNHIESILNKQPKSESELKDVCEAEVNVAVVPDIKEVDDMNCTLPNTGVKNSEDENEYLKLDDEVDQALKQLMKSQEQEFSIAQERLHAQKDYLVSLYQHLEKEKTELVQPTPSTDRDALIGSILRREEHLKLELSKLNDMEKIANGFRRTPKTIIKEHFDIDLED